MKPASKLKPNETDDFYFNMSSVGIQPKESMLKSLQIHLARNTQDVRKLPKKERENNLPPKQNYSFSDALPEESKKWGTTDKSTCSNEASPISDLSAIMRSCDHLHSLKPEGHAIELEAQSFLAAFADNVLQNEEARNSGNKNAKEISPFSGDFDIDGFEQEVRATCKHLQSVEELLLPYVDICVENHDLGLVDTKVAFWMAVGTLEGVSSWIEHHLLRVHYSVTAINACEEDENFDSDGIVGLTCLAHATHTLNMLVNVCSILWQIDWGLNSRALLQSSVEVKRGLQDNMLNEAGYDIPKSKLCVMQSLPQGVDESPWTSFLQSYWVTMPHIPLLSGCVRVMRLQFQASQLASHFSMLTRDQFCSYNYQYFDGDEGPYARAIESFVPIIELLEDARKRMAVVEARAAELDAAKAASAISIKKSSSRGDDSDSDSELLRQIGTNYDELGLSEHEFNLDIKKKIPWAKYYDVFGSTEKALMSLRAQYVTTEALVHCRASPLVPHISFSSGYRLILSSSMATESGGQGDGFLEREAYIKEVLNELPLRKDGPLSFELLRDMDLMHALKNIMGSARLKNMFEYYTYHLQYSGSDSGRVRNLSSEGLSDPRVSLNSEESLKVEDEAESQSKRVLFLTSALVDILRSQTFPSEISSRAAHTASVLVNAVERMEIGWQQYKPLEFLVGNIVGTSGSVHTSGSRSQVEGGTDSAEQLDATGLQVMELMSASLHDNQVEVNVSQMVVRFLIMSLRQSDLYANVYSSGGQASSSKCELKMSPLVVDISRWNWYLDTQSMQDLSERSVYDTINMQSIMSTTQDCIWNYQSLDASTRLSHVALDTFGNERHSSHSAWRNDSDTRSKSVVYKTKLYATILTRNLAQALLETRPGLSLVAFEIYSCLFADAHAMPFHPHKLHIDLALLSAKLKLTARLQWHCRYLLKHPALVQLKNIPILEDVIDLLVTNLNDSGNWKESMRVMNSVIRDVTGNSPFERKRANSADSGQQSEYASSFFAFRKEQKRAGPGVTLNADVYLARKQKMCDYTQLRLALTLLENGLTDNAVEELHFLIKTVCMREVSNKLQFLEVNMCALSMLVRCYLVLEDLDGCKLVCACIKTIQKISMNTSREPTREASTNDTRTQTTAAILSDMTGSHFIKDVGCTFRNFTSPINYHEGVLPKHCTQELHIDLGMIRAITHFRAKEYILALKSLAPTLLEVELNVASSEYQHSCLLQLADLYLLRAQIQFEASKHTADVYFPALVTSDRVLEIVVQRHIQRRKNTTDEFSSTKSTTRSRNTDTTSVTSNITEDTDFIKLYGSNDGPSMYEEDINVERQNRCPSSSNMKFPGLVPGTKPHITFNHCRQAFRYDTPADLLRDSKLWFERAMLIYIECDESIGAAKCASHLVRCDLEAMFVPCVYFFTPWAQACDISPLNLPNVHLSSNSGRQPDTLNAYLPEARYHASLHDTPKQNPRTGNSELSIDETEMFLEFAEPLFANISDPFHVIDCNLHRAEIHVLRNDTFASTRWFSEARDLFLHLFVDGTTVPVARRANLPLLRKISKILNRLLRFLWTCDPTFINDNIALFDIHLSFTSDYQLAKQLHARVSHRLNESLTATLATLCKCAEPDAKVVPAPPVAQIFNSFGLPSYVSSAWSGDGSQGSGGRNSDTGGSALSLNNDSRMGSLELATSFEKVPGSGGYTRSTSQGDHFGQLTHPSFEAPSQYSSGLFGKDSDYYSGTGSLGSVGSKSVGSGSVGSGSGSASASAPGQRSVGYVPQHNKAFSGYSVHSSTEQILSFETRESATVLSTLPNQESQGVPKIAITDALPDSVTSIENATKEKLSECRPSVTETFPLKDVRISGFLNASNGKRESVVVADAELIACFPWLLKCHTRQVGMPGVAERTPADISLETDMMLQNIFRSHVLLRKSRSRASTLKPIRALQALSVMMQNIRGMQDQIAPENMSYIGLMGSLEDRSYPINTAAVQLAVDAKVRFRRLVIVLQLDSLLLMYHPHIGQKHVQLYGCKNYTSFYQASQILKEFLQLPPQSQHQQMQRNVQAQLAERHSLYGLTLPSPVTASEPIDTISLPRVGLSAAYVSQMQHLSMDGDDAFGVPGREDVRRRIIHELREGLMNDAVEFLRRGCNPCIYLPTNMLAGSTTHGPSEPTDLTQNFSEDDLGEGSAYKHMHQQQILQHQQRQDILGGQGRRSVGMKQQQQQKSGFSGFTTMITRGINRLLDISNTSLEAPQMNAPITLVCSRSLQCLPWELFVDENESMIRSISITSLVGQIRTANHVTGPAFGARPIFVGCALGLSGVPVKLKKDISDCDMLRRQIAVEHMLPEIHVCNWQNKASLYTKTDLPPSIDIKNTRVPFEIIQKYKNVIRSCVRHDWPCCLPLLPLGKTIILLRSKSLRQVSFVDLTTLAYGKVHPRALKDLVAQVDNNQQETVPNTTPVATSPRTQSTVPYVGSTQRFGNKAPADEHRFEGQYQDSSKVNPPLPPRLADKSSPGPPKYGGEFVPNPAAASFTPGGARVGVAKAAEPATRIVVNPEGDPNKFYVVVLTFTDLLEMSQSVMRVLAHRGNSKMVCIFSPHFCVGSVVKEIVRSLELWCIAASTEEVRSVTPRYDNNFSAKQQPWGSMYGQGGAPGRGHAGAQQQVVSSQAGTWDPTLLKFRPTEETAHESGATSASRGAGAVNAKGVLAYHCIMSTVQRMQTTHATQISVFM